MTTASRRDARARLKSYLQQKALKQGEICQAQGRPDRAAAWYQWAGAFHQAARSAIAAGDERRAVACSLRAALGALPARFRGAGALQAAELLAAWIGRN